jgi:hypothetical protein
MRLQSLAAKASTAADPVFKFLQRSQNCKGGPVHMTLSSDSPVYSERRPYSSVTGGQDARHLLTISAC